MGWVAAIGFWVWCCGLAVWCERLRRENRLLRMAVGVAQLEPGFYDFYADGTVKFQPDPPTETTP
jgi:hypothetical protein